MSATPRPWRWDGPPCIEQPCRHGSEWSDHGPDILAGSEDNPDYVATATGYDASDLTISTDDMTYLVIAVNQHDALLAFAEVVRALDAEKSMALRADIGLALNALNAALGATQ